MKSDRTRRLPPTASAHVVVSDDDTLVVPDPSMLGEAEEDREQPGRAHVGAEKDSPHGSRLHNSRLNEGTIIKRAPRPMG